MVEQNQLNCEFCFLLTLVQSHFLVSLFMMTGVSFESCILLQPDIFKIYHLVDSN